MPRTITMAVDLPASPARLYRMYLTPALHAAFTGAPVKIAARAGAAFQAFGGALSGKILQLAPNRLIVQSWRSTHFGTRDLDSTLSRINHQMPIGFFYFHINYNMLQSDDRGHGHENRK